MTSYVHSLSGRIQALARAHDRITSQSWGPAPLAGLFDDEIAAHQGAAGRFTVHGPEVLLRPQAIATMALVVHELFTNSCKYGALSSTGRVEVTTEAVNGEGVYIRWQEIGGPAVTAPTRRGFGSVILERTISFDLQGAAEIRYLMAGLEASFFIPQQHIFIAPDAQQPSPLLRSHSVAVAVTPMANEPLQDASVLLVEDNMLIALEAEDMLVGLGASRVSLAATVTEAEQFLDAQSYQFAMLDINVGLSTTFDLADRLKCEGVPFIFASGYGEGLALERRSGEEVVIQKPYERDHLARAVHQAKQRILLE